MIWQFEEMGYDISIDYNGRVGNKPILWNYLTTRPRMNPVFSSLIHLKTTEPAFSTTDYSLSFATAVKRIELNHPDKDVRIIGNFDVLSQSADPNFSRTGTWYDYFSGEALEVTNVNEGITLEPGEYRIYTTKALTTPDLPTSIRKELQIKNDLVFFPNPVSNVLFVEGKTGITEIKVTDIVGRIIKVLSPNSSTATIDFNGMDSGVYLLIVQQKNSRIVQRVVKR